jgi:hypothetical protein
MNFEIALDKSYMTVADGEILGRGLHGQVEQSKEGLQKTLM